MNITIGHTPDMDDACMFYALLNHKIDTEGLSFNDTLKPISELNRDAQQQCYDLSALSVGAYLSVSDTYDILETGACMAEKRGPVLVCFDTCALDSVAVPGFQTTAARVYSVYNSSSILIEEKFDRILDKVMQGVYSGGVLISEDQLCIDKKIRSIDLGAWWNTRTGYPLPLGIDIVKRSLPSEVKKKIHRVFKRSIQYAIANQDEAMASAIQFARSVDIETGKTFVNTFVNDFTIDLGERGKEALRIFLKEVAVKSADVNAAALRFINGEML